MTTYPTRVDTWIWPFLILALVAGPLSVAGGAWLMRTDMTGGAVLLVTGLLLSLLLLVCWPVHYTLTDEALVVRFGQVRWRVPYAEITDVYPTRSIVSSPAWSLDRLWVVAKGPNIMISPRDKAGFLTDLASRDPALELRDGRITRRSAVSPV